MSGGGFDPATHPGDCKRCGVVPAVLEPWLGTVHCSGCGDFVSPASAAQAEEFAALQAIVAAACPSPFFPWLSDPAGGC